MAICEMFSINLLMLYWGILSLNSCLMINVWMEPHMPTVIMMGEGCSVAYVSSLQMVATSETKKSN